MIKTLSYLLAQGIATDKEICSPLEEDARGLPYLTSSPCQGSDCKVCVDVCPTGAITVIGVGIESKVALDLGSCIGCSLCIDSCPTGTIAENRSTQVSAVRRQDLVLTNDNANVLPAKEAKQTPFAKSLTARVVSTGCSACDLEIGASGNPIFDMERFGVRIVASPRHADALLVTGPVGKGMQMALRRCYDAMAEPKFVVAVGTCAISGGVHNNGYAEANGVENILPVDVYVPGCPPHPWSIIHGIFTAMGKSLPKK